MAADQASVLLCLILISSATAAAMRPLLTSPAGRSLLALAPPFVPTLSYHGGPLLTGPALRLHLLWYGAFPASQQAVITDFISSFQANSPSPSVATWWKTTCLYKDASNDGAPSLINLGVVASDPTYSMGKSLTKSNIATLLQRSIADGALPKATSPDHIIYVVFTAHDVLVEDFCMSSCGFHSTTSSASLPFIWVGNAATQCPGFCAWPFAVPEFGPPGQPLRPPSGDAAADGMVINLATLLAGTVTNPFGSGYFPSTDDDNAAGFEAATACTGMFGKGSYPGYPGALLVDQASGATYNALGFNNRPFLLPAVWSPETRACEALI